MGLGSVKTVTVSPGYAPPSSSKPKYAGGTEEKKDPTVEALQDTFDSIINGGQSGEQGVGSIPDDPFAALRLAVEGVGGTPKASAEDFAGVPDFDALLGNLVAIDPSLNTFGQGLVQDNMFKLQASLIARKKHLEEKLAQGLGSPDMMNAMQVVYDKVVTALKKFDSAMAKVEEMASVAKENWKKEIENVPQVLAGKLDAHEADLNGDGIYGNPADSDWAIGIQNIDGEKTYTVIDKKTKKVPQHNKDGVLLQDGVIDPNYKWEMTKAGLNPFKDSDNTKENIKTDLTAELSAATKGGINNNTFGAQIDFAIPEAIWVEADEKHPDRPKIGDDGRMVVPFNGFTNEAPLDDGKTYIQVKVTDASVASDKPINLDSKNKADGMDHIITLKSRGDTIMKIRIAGRTSTAGDDAMYVHNGFVAASSVGFAVNGNQRTSPVNLAFENSFVSTGRHVADSILSKYDGLLPSVDGNSNDEKRKQKAMHDTMDRLTNSTIGGEAGYTTSENRTGAFIVGVKGYIKGTKFNDFISVPDLEPAEDETGAEYTTVVDAGYGWNAVIAGKGNHDIRGATYVKINGADGDRNYIDTPSSTHALTWKANGDASTGDANPMVYIDVETPGGTAHINNTLENGLKGEQNDIRDDYYQINSGEVAFTNMMDMDTQGIGTTLADPAGMKTTFGDSMKAIGDFIKNDEKKDDSAELELDEGIADAKYYNAVKSELDGAFKAFEQAWGMASEDEDPADDNGESSPVDKAFGK